MSDALTYSEPIKSHEETLMGGEKKIEHQPGTSDYMLMVLQVGALLVWTFCTQYGGGVLPGTKYEPTNANVYPCFQDVNVMIFIGFGYLMTYIKAQG